MTDHKPTATERRAVITGLGVVAAGIGAVAATSAQAQSAGFSPARHELDAWMDEIPGQHRVFIDTNTALGGAEALLFGTNILNSHTNAYSGSDDEVAMIVCFRHYSTAFGFNDAIWDQYGAQLVNIMQYQGGDATPTSNPMNGGAGPNAGFSIGSLRDRGVQYAICENATGFFSRALAGATGGVADDIYAQLRANAIDNGRFVPAGVVAATRAQEYGYSLLYAG